VSLDAEGRRLSWVGGTRGIGGQGARDDGLIGVEEDWPVGGAGAERGAVAGGGVAGGEGRRLGVQIEEREARHV
jgi:hypothetical protein